MTLFIIIVGALLVAVIAALVLPLIRTRPADAGDPGQARALSLMVLREQRADLERERAEGTLDDNAYAQAKEELERRALDDALADAPLSPNRPLQAPRAALAVAIALLLPLLTVGIYAFQGTPDALIAGKQTGAGSDAHSATPEQVAAMVERLAQRMAESPDDGQGWLMLARSYAALGRFAESAAAYGKATALLSPNAQMLADYADAMAMAQGRSLRGEPEKLLRQALQADPDNVKALALAGTAAFDQHDYAQAIAHWQKILARLPPDNELAEGIQNGIREARERMGGGAGQPPAARQQSKPAAAKAPTADSVSGTVSLAPAVKAKAAPGDTVFIFARAANGPKMPLAILKKTVAELPAAFELGDSQMMTPDMKLSDFPEVIVGARISKSGDAIARAGDIEGFSAPTAPGAKNLKVVIDSVRN
ncbi:c-type cytochrome biogenesis protein CcmI [Denitratisoma sp. DHT3]|uniref:c-type cytochrome biogenesis protein CcmI n=1 Tax=Denitratisoma sp. DHT3 TaxID=1981880 RepID=UPI001198B1ED|nr:c-type cytochrome biogenesis protein CcmI [Denitratisoma sp. DHT3]QDX81782.1 c-type cytochrome biogenesis protein CcmI [Denitratisoma sp. DHT3]